MIDQSFRSTWKNLHSTEFQQAQTQRKEVINKEKSNEVVQRKTQVESTT